MFIVFPWGSCILFSVKFNSLILALNLARATVRADDLQDALILGGGVLVQVTGLEGKSTWIIIVNNANGGFAVGTFKFLFGVRIVQLNIEVLIGLPVIVIMDCDRHFFESFVVGKLNNLIDCLVVFTGLSVAIKSADTNFTGFLALIQDFNVNKLRCFTN